MVYVVLFTIIVLYFIFALLPLRVCAVCIAVSLTWAGLLAGYFLGWHNDLLLIAILMGGSVVGFSYKAERYFKDKKLTNFWLVRIAIIALGFLAIYIILTAQWSLLVYVGLFTVLLGFFMLFFVKPEKNMSQNSLKNKLDHCCD